jgi:hypothetical protein
VKRHILKSGRSKNIAARAATIREGGSDCQLDSLDHNTDTLSYSAHTLQLTTVDHSTRLATAPQPVFHCNQLLWHPLPTLTFQPSTASLAPLSEIYNVGTDRREETFSERSPKKHPLVVTR